MTNGTIRWVPGSNFRAQCARAGLTLPDVLTEGYAGSIDQYRYVDFPEIRVAVDTKGTPDEKVDLRRLWEAAMASRL